MEIEGSGVVTNTATAGAGRGRRLKASSTQKDGTRRPGALVSKQKRQEAAEKEKASSSLTAVEQQQKETTTNNNTATTENKQLSGDASQSNREVSRPGGGLAEGRPTPPSSPNSLGRGGGGRGRVVVSNRTQPTRRPSNQKIEASDEEEDDDDDEDEEDDEDDNKNDKTKEKERTSKQNNKKGKEDDDEEEEEEEDEYEGETDTSDEESGGGAGSRRKEKKKESKSQKRSKEKTEGQPSSRMWARRKKRALTPIQPPRPTGIEPECVLPPYPNPNGENYGVATRPGDNKRYTRCRRCCLYKVQVPSKKEHICRDDLMGHKWEQCPTKNKRAHMKEIKSDNQEEGSKGGEGVARRGESIVLRKTGGGAVTTQRGQQGRGKTSWFNLQRRRIVFSDSETDKHKQIVK